MLQSDTTQKSSIIISEIDKKDVVTWKSKAFLWLMLDFFSLSLLQSVSSVSQLCPTLCDPMNRSTPGLPVHHQLSLLEFTQAHAHQVSDAIQPSHPVVPFSTCPQSLPASGSFPMSQLFAWGGQSTGVSASASVLLMNTQDWSPLGWTGWISLQSKGLSRVFSNTTVKKHLCLFLGKPLIVLDYVLFPYYLDKSLSYEYFCKLIPSVGNSVLSLLWYFGTSDKSWVGKKKSDEAYLCKRPLYSWDFFVLVLSGEILQMPV